MREYSKNINILNPDFKGRMAKYSKMKYHKDVNFRMSKIQKGCEIYERKKEQKDIDVAIDYFKREVVVVQSLCALSVTAYFSESRFIECRRECYEDKGEKNCCFG